MQTLSSLSPIVIVGMHRSGTSVVSSIVCALGISLGEHLLGASYANPTGHFEDLEFLEIHENILRESKGAWDAPPSRERLFAACDRFRVDIQELVSRRIAAGEAWGWKEPRTSLLLSIYASEVPQMKLIRCRRNREHICASLAKRNGFSARYALKLTDYYEAEIDDFVEEHPHIPVLTVHYDRLVREPRTIGGELARYLGLTADVSVMTDLESRVLSRRETQSKAEALKGNYRARLIRKAVFNPAKASRVLLEYSRRRTLRFRWALRH